MSASKKPKIQIKRIRPTMAMDANYAQNTWNLLKNAIQEIHKKNASGLSFEELYRNAYNLVLHKFGDKLYGGLKDTVSEHLQEVADSVASSNEDNFLLSLDRSWADHTQSMLMIRDILMYMDRIYVVHTNVAPVFELGLRLFKDIVIRDTRIRPRLQQQLLDTIYRERNGEMINKSLMKNLLQMLMNLGVQTRTVYEEEFEVAFLSSSSAFYKLESQSFISTNSAPEYLKKVERRLQEEVDRVKSYLDPATESKIRDKVEHELITVHMRTIIEMPGSGLVHMLKDDKLEDLLRMYRLLGRVQNGHATMRKIMEDFVKTQGKAIVEDPENAENPNRYVQGLLDLKDKYDEILLHSMGNNDKNFQHTLNQAFEYFINLNNKSPEFISLFIDDKLRKGVKGVNEEETENVLDKVMMLFRFLQEKDIFEKYYKQHLAKRLLLNRSVSDDSERTMIAKLKNESGYQFTSKLEGMFQDMKQSAITSEGFKTHLATLPGNPLRGIELNVHVLTTGFWPTQTTPKCSLPPEVEKCCEVFEKYYLNSHNGRRLYWQTNMGSGDLRAFFGDTRRELSVTTYQVCILLLYNNRDTLTFRELAQMTQIPQQDLKRNLFALCANPKCRILLKEPRVKKFSESDTFQYNSEFKSKLFRVKLLPVLQRESEPEREQTKTKIDEDRKHMIDAAVVRVMKARKSMAHAQLVAEVTKQLAARFRPDPVLIKKRIESLIEREYLERSANDRKIYNYLA